MSFAKFLIIFQSPKIRTSGEYKNMETIAGRQLASQMSAAAAMERERLKVTTPVTKVTATLTTVAMVKTENSAMIDVVSMDTPPKLTLSVAQPSDTSEL